MCPVVRSGDFIVYDSVEVQRVFDKGGRSCRGEGRVHVRRRREGDGRCLRGRNY